MVRTIYKKIYCVVVLMLSLILTLVFSVAGVYAAQLLSINGSVGVTYEAPTILIDGTSFSNVNVLPYTTTRVLFDYWGDKYVNYLDLNSYKEVYVDTLNLGCEEGGISLFYSSNSSDYVYVLSKNEIFANPDCSNMFNLKPYILDISFVNFNTTLVKNMENMFSNCQGLTEFDLSCFDTGNVDNMHKMFHRCINLTKLNISSFNTSKVTNMCGMFYQCYALKMLDLSSFNTHIVSTMSEMFYECSDLITIYVSNGWNTDAVTNSSEMFKGCYDLVGEYGHKFDSDSRIDKLYARIDAEDNIGYLTSAYYLIDGDSFNDYIYDGSTPNEIIFGSYESYKNVINNVTPIPVAVDGDGNIFDKIQIYDNGTTLYVLSKGLILANPNCELMFSSGSLTIGSPLTSIKFFNFATHTVETMRKMFYGVYSLPSLDLGVFNTCNVKDMSWMFSSCGGLTNLDVESFNTSKVKNMSYMFQGVNVSNLNLKNFTADNLEDATSMFRASGIVVLNLRNFKIDSSKIVKDMFYGSNKLTTIYVKESWNLSTYVASKMFEGCTSLVGGNKTTYSRADSYYARIDTVTSPGYFTYDTNI